MRSETVPHTSVKNQRPGLAARCACAAIALAALVLLSGATPAVAEPLAEKRAKAAKIARQVSALENEFDHLQERYRGAEYRLKDLDKSIDELSDSLDRTRSELDVAETRLIGRVVTVYRDGAGGTKLVALARSGSVAAFLDRLETIDRVSQQDKDIVEEIRQLRTKVVIKKRQLKTARVEQIAVVKQSRRDKQAMAAKLRKRQQVLASVTGEIRQLVDAERARQAAAAQAAARASGEGVSSFAGGGAGPAQGTDVGAALSTPVGPPPSAPAGASSAVSAAMSQIGVPYKWGGSSPSTGFDCSGLVMWAYAQVGVSLPHSTYALWDMGTRVSRDQLQSGDLVFSSGLGHMGLYIGGGNFVHAPRTGTFVRVDSIHSSYGTRNWVGAVRL